MYRPQPARIPDIREQAPNAVDRALAHGDARLDVDAPRPDSSSIAGPPSRPTPSATRQGSVDEAWSHAPGILESVFAKHRSSSGSETARSKTNLLKKNLSNGSRFKKTVPHISFAKSISIEKIDLALRSIKCVELLKRCYQNFIFMELEKIIRSFLFHHRHIIIPNTPP
jgi:hypothetical protein